MMKKITLLLTLMITSLGFSQTLPFDFSSADQLMSGGDGATTSIVQDAGNDVLQLVGASAPWDNAQIEFAQNVDLSDDANNTITFRIKPVNGTGSGDHLLKFELPATGANQELGFTTTGTDWQVISLDFPAGLSNYGRIVIFVDKGAANANVSDTYLIDDIAGGTNAPIPLELTSLPFDFSDPNELMTGDGGAVTSIIQDAGNDVLQLIGATAPWDNAQIKFARNVDLSDDANNTITFRIKPVNGTGSGDHLIKFELPDSGADQELEFTTTGTDWQTIALNFGAGLSNYGRIVIFTDKGAANANVSDTYLIDDITGPIVALPEVPGTPPVPTSPNAEVLALMADITDTGGFTNFWNPSYYFGANVGTPDLDPTAAESKAVKMDFSAQGWGGGINDGTDVYTDVSAYGFLNFSYYAPTGNAGANGHEFKFILIGGAAGPSGGAGEYSYTLKETGNGGDGDIVFSQWVNVSVPLSHFVNLGWSPTNFFQFKLGTTSDINTKIVYFDNMFFSVNAGTLGVSNNKLLNVSLYPNPTSSRLNISAQSTIKKATIYNVLGKQVMSLDINKNSESIDVSNLPSGIYLIKYAMNNAVGTAKFIKQ